MANDIAITTPVQPQRFKVRTPVWLPGGGIGLVLTSGPELTSVVMADGTRRRLGTPLLSKARGADARRLVKDAPSNFKMLVHLHGGE